MRNFSEMHHSVPNGRRDAVAAWLDSPCRHTQHPAIPPLYPTS